jgi:hypothetical protein
MKRTFALLAVALLVSVGCSDSSGPKNADVSGSWTYNATNLQGGGLSCNASGTSMTFTQLGATFSGTYSGGSISCTGAGGSATLPVGTGVVAGGTVSGSSVVFNFDTQDWANTGTLSGATIAGTVVIRVVSGTTSVVLTGSFSAVKR